MDPKRDTRTDESVPFDGRVIVAVVGIQEALVFNRQERLHDKGRYRVEVRVCLLWSACLVERAAFRPDHTKTRLSLLEEDREQPPCLCLMEAR